eukprot:527905-Pyramimonas_sp.AAC.1
MRGGAGARGRTLPRNVGRAIGAAGGVLMAPQHLAGRCFLKKSNRKAGELGVIRIDVLHALEEGVGVGEVLLRIALGNLAP